MISSNTLIGRGFASVEITITILADDLNELEDWFNNACETSGIDMSTKIAVREATEEEVQLYMEEDVDPEENGHIEGGIEE